MLPEIIFSFFAKSAALLTLAAFMLAHNLCDGLGRGNSPVWIFGSKRNTVGGLSRRRAQVVRHLRGERGIYPISGNDHDTRSRFRQLAGRYRGRRSGVERLLEGRRRSHHQRAREHCSFSTLGEAGDFSAERSQRKADRQHSTGHVAQFSQSDFTHARRARSAERGKAGGVRPFGARLTGAVHRRGRCRAFVAARYHRSAKIRTAHVDGPGDGADSLPVHFGGHHQGSAGKISGAAGSISTRDTSRNQTCVDQSGYGKEDHRAETCGSPTPKRSKKFISERS